MDDKPLVVGELVRLKSGGPVMCIRSLVGSKGELMCDCSWFDTVASHSLGVTTEIGYGELQVGNFHSKQLVRVEKP